MPLYVGLPLIAKEALRILNFDVESTLRDIKIKNDLKNDNYICDHHIQSVLKEYFEKHRVNIRLYITDKNQCILGYKSTAIESQDEFVDINKFITMMSDLKEIFEFDLDILNADLSSVTLEHMEGLSEIVKHPMPYVLNYN